MLVGLRHRARCAVADAFREARLDLSIGPCAFSRKGLVLVGFFLINTCSIFDFDRV